MKTFVLILFCCLCGFCESLAQKSNIFAIFGPNFDALDKQTRLAFAKSLLAEVEIIFDAIPNVSPEQSVWLQKEEERIEKLKGTTAHSPNMVNFMQSKERRLRTAKQGFKNMQTTLRDMESAENSKTALQSWVILSYVITDEEIFEQLKWLEKEGTVTLPKKSENSALRSGFGTLIGREVMKTIVLEGVRQLGTGKRLEEK